MKKLSILSIFFTILLSLSVHAGTEKSWELVSDSDGYITKRMKVDGSSLFAFRGETVADVPFSKVISIFLDVKKQKDWVDMFGGAKSIKTVSELERVYWIRFNTPFIISDRDYVLHTVGKPDAEAKTFTANIRSVAHQEAPSKDCCVRAEAKGTYYKFTALPDNKTKIEVEVHTDPKGKIPSWITNMVQKNWPKKTLSALVREAARKSTESHPEYLSWDAS